MAPVDRHQYTNIHHFTELELKYSKRGLRVALPRAVERVARIGVSERCNSGGLGGEKDEDERWDASVRAEWDSEDREHDVPAHCEGVWRRRGNGGVAMGDNLSEERRVQRLHSVDTCSLCVYLSQLVLGGHSADAERVVLGRDDEETELVGCAVWSKCAIDSEWQVVRWDAETDAGHAGSRPDGAGGAGEHRQHGVPSGVVRDGIERGSRRRE
ncbi:hypothetical protein BLNAU_20724 [Blattamonas nauphoetae]|uniref:Uncharacterized protein n=1 Tax=Blattamonas nauphoetae TaxID=2049346 RepID=A0ABQ9WZ30_9EUKA|nr:hypothetical protein BLNAU_20724 [Blattamonas nauphoetae]